MIVLTLNFTVMGVKTADGGREIDTSGYEVKLFPVEKFPDTPVKRYFRNPCVRLGGTPPEPFLYQDCKHNISRQALPILPLHHSCVDIRARSKERDFRSRREGVRRFNSCSTHCFFTFQAATGDSINKHGINVNQDYGCFLTYA